MNKVAAVLFDLDGVLVDACDLHKKALDTALTEIGYEITEDEHLSRYNGRPTRVKLQMLTNDKGLPVELHEQVSRRKQELTFSLIDEMIKPNNKAQHLLHYLKIIEQVKTACCSNSMSGSIAGLLLSAGLAGYIDVQVGNDEGFAPKPAPDLFLEGARRLGIPIEQCVIVEDSPVGLEAAYAAKPLRVVVVKGPEEVNSSLLPRIFGE